MASKVLRWKNLYQNLYRQNILSKKKNSSIILKLMKIRTTSKLEVKKRIKKWSKRLNSKMDSV